MLAYLVIREGAKWTDVFRLIPGQTVTIGRAPTNQIVVRDDRCSRYHAEIFLADGKWTVRDLESHNGTTIDNHPIAGDHVLSPGDVVRIGRSQMAFVHDLSKAFPDSSSLIVKEFRPEFTERELTGDATVPLPSPANLQILHRIEGTRYLEAREDEAQARQELIGRALQTCRIGFQIAAAHDFGSAAETALDGLTGTLDLPWGAVLLTKKAPLESTSAVVPNLQLLRSRGPEQSAYVFPPDELLQSVLKTGESLQVKLTAVAGDPARPLDAAAPPSIQRHVAVPLKKQGQIAGLLHAYGSAAGAGKGALEAPAVADLEFALALADFLSIAWDQQERAHELDSQLTQLRDDNHQLKQQLGISSDLVGKSLALSRVNEAVVKAGASKNHVLVIGENGVGKDLVARAIHNQSPRPNAPFVTLNCSALTEEELAVELFGLQRGPEQVASPRRGKLELAHGGTLVLHEVVELPLPLQTKLFKVLEGHSFERTGGSPPIRCELRLVSTTSRDIDREVAEGRFRQDLYVRIQGSVIHVPALHRRMEDIPDLAVHFLERFGAEIGRRFRGFTPRALEKLIRHRWPGNVRELKNCIERAVTFARFEQIDEDDLLLAPQPEKSPAAG